MTALRMTELDRHEALRLLGTVGLGRIVFTEFAMPAVRPVNHILDDGDIIIRTHTGAALLSAVDTVVAYEADQIEPDEHTGWSVVVTGFVRAIKDPAVVARYEQVLKPWVERNMDQVLRIHPEIVDGFLLTGGTERPRTGVRAD